MQREQRAEDNWPLLYAQEKAQERGVPFCVVFCMVTEFVNAGLRHYDFLMRGMEETERDLNRRNIPFILLEGEPTELVPKFAKEHGVGEVVCDFNPLRFTDAWREEVGGRLSVRLTEVDGRNIIPCWVASDKEEFAAHTFRPKVHRQLKEFLTSFPSLEHQADAGPFEPSNVDWQALRAKMRFDESVGVVDWITPGTQAAKLTLRRFLDERIDAYAEKRNDPNEQVLSDLSPYLHFGHVSAQWIALKTNQASDTDKEGRDAFLEELIVRRELTDNFCHYNKQYDKVEGAHEWAQKTIAEHDGDEREYVYERQELEAAKTHDELWNAMQRQMVTEGKMHGWCRMYWAKKILEWSPHFQTAVDRALYLNDKYELDGRDPNGVVGVMWSICGVHDRAWTERPIFGKIRYMNFNGAKRKFDVDAYIARYSPEQSLFDE
jgi:deoxyribodipyrimidine photo-lyase